MIEGKLPAYQILIQNIHIIYMDIFKKWCDENCDESFHMKNTNSGGQDDNAYLLITFVSEEDIMAFKLRWT